MIKEQIQPDLLQSRTVVFNHEGAEIEYHPDFIETRLARQLFERLLGGSDWRQEYITLFGKTHKVPRLSCWMGDTGLDYRYSNMTMHPVAWTDTVLSIKQQLEGTTRLSFNSVLINYYRHGGDSNGWHSDDEPELGSDPVIASLSLGGARDFKLRHKTKKGLQYSLSLAHGSLLLMQGNTQRDWQHHVPKRAIAEPRINLTFRTIFPQQQN